MWFIAGLIIGLTIGLLTTVTAPLEDRRYINESSSSKGGLGAVPDNPRPPIPKRRFSDEVQPTEPWCRDVKED